MAVNKSRRQRKVARDKRNRQSGGFNLNAMASPKFIESALSEVLDEIVHIEVQHNTYLAGDRADFDRARVDWRLLTRGQVQHAVSLWRDGIVKRYSWKDDGILSGRRARLQRKIAAEKRSLTVDRFMDQCMPMVCSAGYSHELARIVMSMFSWMVKKNMRGGCHLLSSVLYVALSEEGFNAELCIGECAEPDGTPFDHSWVTVDGKIIDLACYMPLVPHFVSYPIVLSIDVVTGGQPGITYGMTSGLRLSLDTQRVLSKSFCDYMDGYPNGNLWDVVSYVLGRPVDVSVLRAKYAAAVRNVVK